jgi:hypothetical protein
LQTKTVVGRQRCSNPSNIMYTTGETNSRARLELEGPYGGALESLERPPYLLQPPLMVLRGNRKIFSCRPAAQTEEGRGCGCDGYLEVEGLSGGLEVDLDEEEALVVLAEDGLEEAAAANEVEGRSCR